MTKVKLLLLALMIAPPSLVSAGVKTCNLLANAEHIAPSLKLYEYEGDVHSALLEFTTDYGDTLAYLFLCSAAPCDSLKDDKKRLACYDTVVQLGVNCVMDFRGYDYEYLLGVEPDFQSPASVTLVSQSKSDDFKTMEALTVDSCDDRPK